MALVDDLRHGDVAWLFDVVRRRLEWGGSAVAGRVSLVGRSLDQRRAVARLTGLTELYEEGRRSIGLDPLDRALRGILPGGLREAIELVSGPIVDRREVRAQQRRGWAELFSEWGEQVGTQAWNLKDWLADPESRTRIKRRSRSDVERARSLMRGVCTVLARLPVEDVPIAVLAADSLGDAHALDRGEPIGDVVVDIVKATRGYEGREEWRDAWASVGVLCDELSAPVLVLQLRAEGTSTAARTLMLHAESGEPCRLSVRQLTRDTLKFSREVTGSKVYVCENPAVVAAAADRLDRRCAPLVCIEGQPRTAARALLDQLKAAGIVLVYHGDFDWKGIGIANLIAERHGAKPWRMEVADYNRVEGSVDLEGTAVAASWDMELEPEMRRRGKAVHEEQVIEDLLADLAMGMVDFPESLPDNAGGVGRVCQN